MQTASEVNTTMIIRKVDSKFLLSSALGALLVLELVSLTPVIAGRMRSKAQDQKPATLSAAKRDGEDAAVALAELINRAIDESKSASARWGVCVLSLRDGRVLYARNADKLFTPASNMKIFTTGVALDFLGGDYRWRTSVYARSQPGADGTIDGDLVLYGRGAPDLISRTRKENNASLEQLADDLYNHGIRRVRGNVIGDESYFRGEPFGDGWQWTDLQWYFGAEASALSIDGNEIDLNVLPPNRVDAPPAVSMSAPDGYIAVQNRMGSVKRGERMQIGVHRGLSDNNVEVWGQFPLGEKGYGVRLAVHNPALWAARLLVDRLKARGIVVDGQAQARNSRVAQDQRFDPAPAAELGFVVGKTLSEIVKETNKESVNLNAELILRTLGRERGEMIADTTSKGRERGDDEAGLALIRLWLKRAGIPTEEIALHDGSGLSRLDLITPESTVRFLIALSKTTAAQAFHESLPVSGRDGTLGGRLKSLTNQVSAKTGSLTYDNALSGYLTASSGEVLVFSVMCNDQTTRASSILLIDQIVSVLASYPNFSPQNR